MIAYGIALYLEEQGVGTIYDSSTGNGDIFISRTPDSPDNVICVFDEPGTALPENQDYDSDNFGTNILIRGTYAYVIDRIQKTHIAVPAMSGIYDSIRIIDTKIQTPPADIETDEKGRNIYTVHYEHYCNLGNSTNRISNYTP